MQRLITREGEVALDFHNSSHLSQSPALDGKMGDMQEQEHQTTGDYYKIVLPIIIECGKVLVEGFSTKKTVATKSASYDLVTEFDKRIEVILVKQISALFPTHKFIGEETLSEETLTDAPTWIIDPIDGTTNFVHADENCAISVALAVKKEIEIGIVYCPLKNQLFTAQRGKGAWLNGRAIHVTKTTDIKQSLLGFEISLAASEKIRGKLLSRLTALVSRAHGVRCIGTCSLSLCYVAMGAWDGYQVDHLFSWDYSAGALLVKEAGGVVISTDGSPFEIMKRRILATSTTQLADVIVSLFKDT